MTTFLLLKALVLGLRGRLLAVEEEEERQDKDEDGRTQPDAPESDRGGIGRACAGNGFAGRGAGRGEMPGGGVCRWDCQGLLREGVRVLSVECP